MKRQFRYKYFLLGLILLITFFVYIECQSLDDYNEFLEEQNLFLLRERNRITKAQWSHDSNITNFNEINLIEKANAFDEFRKKQAKLVEEYRRTNVTEPLPESLRRQFDKLGFLGVSVLDEIDREQWQASLLRMEKIYSSSKIKLDEDEDSNEINDDYRDGLPLQPDLTQIMATSTDEPLLRKIWQKFRDATGKRIRDDYLKYIDLGNKAAQKLDKGFESYDDIWVSDWNMENFREEMERLINEVMPLYRKIHAYVRFHLNRTYPGVIPKDGTIPAHLLGNMWAQHWSNLLQLIPEMQFFPDVPSIDGAVNEKLQNLTVKEMFQLSEEFFHSLGMRNMTRTFWNRSILERPKGIEMICHASAWDFFERNDFRIKQCTVKTLEHLLVIHHEMGHIQYYMNYAGQPTVFREGANRGFHEAIGDLMALSVVTPQHLSRIGLLDRKHLEKNLDELNLNYQLRMALDKIVFLPFSFLVDKWRWDVFKDEHLARHLNQHWWELRLKYQGISPPLKRSEYDFDPGAKYHVAANVEYMQYFFAHILQFQFYQHLCSYVDGIEKLYECDFYRNKQAGSDLIQMLRKGSSEPWQKILNDFIGTDKLSLGAIFEYFEPLNRTLSEFIEKNSIEIGWDVEIENHFHDPLPSLSSAKTITYDLELFLLLWFVWMLIN